MALLEQWQEYANSFGTDRQRYDTFWNGYFMQEKEIYEKLLTEEAAVTGTVKELAEIYFEGIIAAATGEKEGVAKKPAPDTVRAALGELGVDAERALYVGDSDVDVMTAKNAGMECVSVLWGFRDEAFLREHGAEHFVHTPAELWEYLG